MTAIMGADVLVKCLIQENVRFVFGIPGGQICPILDAIRAGDPVKAEEATRRHAPEVATMLDSFEHPEIDDGEPARPGRRRGGSGNVRQGQGD